MIAGFDTSTVAAVGAVALLVAYVALVWIGRLQDPRHKIPSRDYILYRMFGSKSKRRKWSFLLGTPLLGLYGYTVMSGQPEEYQFAAFISMIMYIPGILFARKMQDIFGEDTRVAVRSREYQHNMERDLLMPRDKFRGFRLLNCNSLDSVWTPQYGETKIALEVDIEDRTITGNWRSIPDARLEGLESDVKRLIEEHAPAKIEAQKLKRWTREIGEEMADIILYRREVGLSDIENPDYETDEDGEVLPPHLAACERLGVPYDRETGDIKLKQATAEVSKETEESTESRYLDVESLKGMGNGKESTNGKEAET